MDITEKIKVKAIQLGFDLVGITTAEPIEQLQIDYFKDWLGRGDNGQMEYMGRNFQKRINPSELLKGAKSVICVALNYKPPENIAVKRVGFANFALYEDYHSFIKNLLFLLAEFMQDLTDERIKFKACVDSAPVAERALAQRAGLGFIGRNHMLINPTLGLQTLLGELITDLPLNPDMPFYQTCKNCDKCIKACPAAALKEDGRFDANSCISYLTIEHHGEIADDLRENIGDSIFGCDRCILACPYDSEAPICKNKNFKLLQPGQNK